MSVANICIIIAIVVYLAAMVIVGIVCSKKNNSVDDFYLGGRQLGPLVTAMSAEASDMSAGCLWACPALLIFAVLPKLRGLLSALQSVHI